ncbi:polysaccharide biosynthesis C-terminal domain-containing protein, partial [Marinobacter sp.]
LALLARRRLISVAWRSEDIRGALRFGVPLIPHVGGAFLLTMADRLVINRELGLESAGIYMVAVQLAMGLSIALEAVNKAYVPWLYERLKRDDPVQKRNIVLGSYAYFGLLLGLAALSFVLGPLVLELLAGERYARAGDVIGWLVLGQAFRGMYLTVTAYIFYRRKTERLSLITIASGGVNLLLLLFMVKRFGLEGAAVSFAISALLLFLFTWWLAARTSPMPWRLTREA